MSLETTNFDLLDSVDLYVIDKVKSYSHDSKKLIQFLQGCMSSENIEYVTVKIFLHIPVDYFYKCFEVVKDKINLDDFVRLIPDIVLSQNEKTRKMQDEIETLRDLNQTLEKGYQQMICLICFDSTREILFMDCNHLCCCEPCAKKLGNVCPICIKDPGEARKIIIP